ncbi:MAG: AAA family ATPase [Bacteroidaceae bacterium]|nr:AAA family ATPase [Bacteroidaceae bacterium]
MYLEWTPANMENLFFPLFNNAYADMFKMGKEGNEYVLYKLSKTKRASKAVGSLQQIFYGAPGTGKSNTIKREVDDKGKLNFRTTFHPDSDYSTFVGCYKPKMKRSTITKDGVTTTEEKIVYSFEPQAFTNAYVQAWKTKDDVYLIIEEINRGNCAQIFGDLFQLLDRKNGESEYPVIADSSLADYLKTALVDSERDDIPADVKNGRKLKLPSNLYIWVTMNTSDQSLFPIDSAFKRRWEWKYMKIKDEGKEWKIDVKIKDANGEEKQVDWWNFIRKVNEIIASMTSSADKQLGYFFCKADKKTPERASDPNGENDLISLDTFVSKVLFYLWNDVFKDYGFEDASLFQYIKTEDGKETKKDLTFPDFYKEDSNEVNSTMVSDFVQKVMNWKKKEEEKN